MRELRLVATAVPLPVGPRHETRRVPSGGLEVRHDLPLHLHLDHPLDLGESLGLLGAHQRDGLACGARAARAADPMNVVLGRIRQLEIDDVRELLDIEPPRRDIGCNQHSDFSRLELVERLRALTLGLVPVNRRGVHARTIQLVRQPVRAQPRRVENQDLVHLARFDEMYEEVALLLARHRVHAMRNQLGRGILPGDLDEHRVAEERVGELLDLVREGGREEQALFA